MEYGYSVWDMDTVGRVWIQWAEYGYSGRSIDKVGGV